MAGMWVSFSAHSLKFSRNRLAAKGLAKDRWQIGNNGIAYSLRLSSSQIETVIELEGSTINISSGKYARMASGCALAQAGDTCVMATAVNKKKATKASFLPLTVDYKQKAGAIGKIPTNFIRRDIGTTDSEILTGRIIDRSIRPLFPKTMFDEIQVVGKPLSLDQHNHPDVLAINAASAALALSEIPWNGPIGAVRLGVVNGKVLINPTKRQLENSQLDLVLSAALDSRVVMLEGSAKNISGVTLKKALKKGVIECVKIAKAIEDLQSNFGKTKRELSANLGDSHEVVKTIIELSSEKLEAVLKNPSLDKVSRDVALADVRQVVVKTIREGLPNFDDALLQELYDNHTKDIFRRLILKTKVRCDGRNLIALRDISCDVNLHKPLHGSSFFQRGQTQVVCNVALDSPNAALKMDPVSILTTGLKEKNFFLHYEFPPYAVNEIGRTGFAGRREIGHGALAEKALRPLIPSDYPFTIRLTSEVMESNGSSSMATVCGGSLALMDAGVPIPTAAAGVAIGLVTEDDSFADGTYHLMVDLLGIEDYYGDMDFKIAGTETGITAIQADVKILGLPMKVVSQAISLGQDGILRILNIMNNVIKAPRTERKDSWPVITKLNIPAHKRYKLLGQHGLKRLEYETGIQIAEENLGEFSMFAANQEIMDETKEIIDRLLATDPEQELTFGGLYTAKIVEIRDCGVMVVLHPLMAPVLLHNSQLDIRKVLHPSALNLEVGQEIIVKYFGRDPVSGTVRLSRKVLQIDLKSASNVTHNLLES